MTEPQKIQAVGAAIGRPPVKISSDVKQHASAEEITSNITGRDTAIATLAILNADCFPPAGGRTSDARPYGCGIVIKSASAKTTIVSLSGRADAIEITLSKKTKGKE